jgi:hypothetical protein
MAELNLPISRAATEISITSKGKRQSLNFARHDTAILFFAESPIAILSGGIVYVHCRFGAEQRAVNEWQEDKAQNRSSHASSFDFVVGQILTTAGLPLTQRVQDA